MKDTNSQLTAWSEPLQNALSNQKFSLLLEILILRRIILKYRFVSQFKIGFDTYFQFPRGAIIELTQGLSDESFVFGLYQVVKS